ncbi:DUF222 domain-containing protein, partial [Rhodococcus daqingensis]
VAVLEPEIVAAARHLTPGPLAGEISRLISEFSAEEAAAQRETAQQLGRRIVKRGRGTTSTIEVTVSPEEAEQVMQLVAEFAATVCPHDRRGKQCRLVDAVMAIMHGEPYLQCSCGRDDCTQAGRTALPGRRAPLTQITIDVATLVGLLSEPAYLHGHGPIDPELARTLAADGTWQALLTEALNLAEELGLIHHDDGDASDEGGTGQTSSGGSATPAAETEAGTKTNTGTPDGADPAAHEAAAPINDTAPQPEPVGADDSGAGPTQHDGAHTVEDVGPEPAAGTDEGPEPEPTPDTSAHTDPVQTTGVTSPPLPPRFCLRSFLARSRRRKAGYVPDFGTLAPPRPCTTTPPAPTSVGTITEAILAAIDADPTLARPEHPDGHGGFATPPDGALTYRPDAATTALVRARDGHCRFPGCTRPAAQCQTDHIVEYWAYNPAAGGWTIESNLQCLCQFHHQLKTLGLWQVTALPGHALLWTSHTGTTAITLPAGAHGSHTLTTPSPHITGRRGHTPSSRPNPPPDPPPF